MAQTESFNEDEAATDLTDNGITPADYRRAAALMTHRAAATNDELAAGVRAIYDEAIENGRLTRLLVAVDEGYRAWISHLRAGRSPEWINELIDDVAANHEDRYIKLAAEAIAAIRDSDDERFQAIMTEVNEATEGGTAARLVGAVADIYHHVLPELATPGGRAALRAWTIEVAARDTLN